MKKLLYTLITVLFSLLVANFIAKDNGYVLIAYDKYTIQSSLHSMISVVFFSAILIIVIVKLFKSGIFILDSFFLFSRDARQKSSKKLMNKSLIEHAKGHWKNAQKLLSKSINYNEAPLLYYLTVARFANANKDYDSCSKYLDQAREKQPKARLIIGITQAELQIERGQLEQALVTLQQLQNIDPKNVQVYKLLYTIYNKLHDWKSLVEILPMLKKLKVFSEDKFEMILKTSYQNFFLQIVKSNCSNTNQAEKIDRAEKLWKKIGKEQQQEIIPAYIDCLTTLKEPDKAEAFLRQVIYNNYSRELIRLYGEIDTSHPGQQLITAEKLLKKYPNDYELLLALGKISLKNKQYKKAESYLRASLAQKKNSDTYKYLGILMAENKRYTESTEFFIKSFSNKKQTAQIQW